MNAKLLMIQGTSSGSGKSTLVVALCRILTDQGYRVVPFKAQNMSSNVYVIKERSHKMIARIQAIQAIASRREPDVRMNPILLKPLGDYQSNVILNGKFHSQMHAKEYYEGFALQKAFPIILNSLDSLRKENDIIIIEGAGSPVEINISKYDIANMLLAEKVSAPVVIVADIERGGCFASIVGTMKLLKLSHRNLVKGFIINKFRGNYSILDSAIKSVEKITRRKIFGIIPKADFNLPDEDSLNGNSSNKLVFSKESLDEQIDLLANIVQQCIDIQEILSQVVALTRK